MVSWLLLPLGCLERVTGEPVPLDPRFYAGQEDQPPEPGEGEPDPNGGPPSGEGPVHDASPKRTEAPWADYEGESWTLEGTVEAPGSTEVQVDISEPDATAEGGQRRAGALRLPGSGSFSLRVPTAVTELRLQAFQDANGNGPDDADPFAEASVTRAGDAPTPVVLSLEAGARGGPGGTHTEAPPGAPGGPAHVGAGEGTGGAGAPAPPPDGLVFPDGPAVTLSGTVTSSRQLPVILDFFKTDTSGSRGRTYLGRRTVSGSWSQSFPRDFGQVEIEAYQDLTGNTRSADDPTTARATVVPVGDRDRAGIVLAIP